MSVALAPMISAGALWLLLGCALALAAYGVASRAAGAGWRAIAAAALLAGLANPAIIREQHQSLGDVVALVVDRSQSQALEQRARRTNAALAELRSRLRAMPDLEVRIAEPDDAADGTRLFDAAEKLLQDVPADRIAGIVMITDGQVHDAPAGEMAGLGPVHALLTGDPALLDRRLIVEQAPKYGIAGQDMQLTLRVEDHGPVKSGLPVQVDMRINGAAPTQHLLPPGISSSVTIKLDHAGANIIDFETQALAGELTQRNNRVSVTVSGVRDRLRVLLVSGEPSPGERTWRNLLKADPAVDLVHFTILRPPDKLDDTPAHELSLISFPVNELFNDKLADFDLIIFDRYQQRGVLTFRHFNKIANYVEKGGALLEASGPDFAAAGSIYQTPLAVVLPAQPTGNVRTGGFKPLVTAIGNQHPVTAALPGASGMDEQPLWGRWFRFIEARQLAGKAVMAAPGGEPLLILDRFGKGRVAQLLSDHTWLWARGFEGGGPQAELLRRLAHWLMQEPDLEEEHLSAIGAEGKLNVLRRSLEKDVPPVEIEFPDGRRQTIQLRNEQPGRFTGTVSAPEAGIYRLDDGALQTVIAVGEANPREFADVSATGALLSPVAAASGGGIFWLKDTGVPDLRRVRAGRDLAGSNWMGLRENGRYVVQAMSSHPLLPPVVLLMLSTTALSLAWWREGR